MKSFFSFVFLLLPIVFIPVISSCSTQIDDRSFLSGLDSVDNSISSGDTGEAVKQLRSLEKKAHSSFARIGVYRRYMVLGETNSAERVMVRGLSKIPGNRELSAVYGHFLLRQNRVPEAVAVLRCLSGTPYGSLYSEALFRNMEITHGGNINYFSKDLSNSYYDAYAGTRDWNWYINVVLIYLAEGNYAAAESMEPQKADDPLHALFWAQIRYDNCDYAACLKWLERESSPAGKNRAATLRADSYLLSGDISAAENYRTDLLKQAASDPSIIIDPSVYINSALWAKNHKNIIREYELVSSVIEHYPYYIPGIILYGDYAYESSKPKYTTDLDQAVRSTKLRTLDMIQSDAIPKISAADALLHMNALMEKQKKETNHINPELVVACQSLSDIVSPPVNNGFRIAAVWKLLEDNETGVNLYPPVIMQYAVHELLRLEHQDDARALFIRYLNARYNLSSSKETGDAAEKETTDIFGGSKRNPAHAQVPVDVVAMVFGDSVAGDLSSMELWECEVSAYFALADSNFVAAQRIYEYVLFQTGKDNSASSQDVQNYQWISEYASIPSIINLAMIYSSTGRYREALKLYTAAAGMERDSYLKSRILYRSAVIQNNTGNTTDARLALEYSLSLDPVYADAHLLLKNLAQ
jgi:tetratricopeptide (TPR) repeat protein